MKIAFVKFINGRLNLQDWARPCLKNVLNFQNPLNDLFYLMHPIIALRLSSLFFSNFYKNFLSRSFWDWKLFKWCSKSEGLFWFQNNRWIQSATIVWKWFEHLWSLISLSLGFGFVLNLTCGKTYKNTDFNRIVILYQKKGYRL